MPRTRFGFVLVVALGTLTAAAQPAAAQPATDAAAVQQAYVKASNTDSLDHFGQVVAVDGDTFVVGAPDERSAATGVDGDQRDDSVFYAGAAYVFVRTGADWAQQAYLKASNNEGDDVFGSAVAISGDTIVIGAPGEDSPAAGVDGSQGDGLSNAGAAYVFVRDASGWSQQAYLKASNPSANDVFGSAVAISDDTIVVGAYAEDTTASNSGAVYVFVREGGTWSEQALLKASNPGASDGFGYALAIDGERIVAGAYGEDSGSTGVNGPQASESKPSSGAAYIFSRSGGTWTQEAYLKASNTDEGDLFGYPVAVRGETVAVGATTEDSLATGVNGGHPWDNGATDSGAAYVFVRIAGEWSQQAYVKASNTGAFDRFGRSVALSDDTLVVGTGRENSAATGIDGDQQDESALDAGAAYVFVRSGGAGGTWAQVAYVKASNTGTDDNFGDAADLSGDSLVVGAFQESGSATGIDGPDDDEAYQAGAAYVFDLGLDPWQTLGFGLAGVAGVPALTGDGPLTTGSAGSLVLADAAPSAPAMLFVSLSSTPTPFKCGTLATVPPAFQLPLATSGAGSINLAWGAWPAGLSGLDLHFQHAIADGTAPCGVALSNALRASVP